jgi:hypothetical protein
MSGSTASPLENGPETPFVVEAVDALLRSDVVAARLALIEGAEATSWAAIAHRLDVAGHALAVDAGLHVPADDDPGRDEILLLPGLDTSSWAADEGSAVAGLIARWTTDDQPADLPLEQVWSTLVVVSWMVERAGFPAEVVV